MAVAIPLSFFLQTVPAMHALPAAKVDQVELLDEKDSDKLSSPIDDKKNDYGLDLEKMPTENENDDKNDTFSAPTIKTALIEAFSSPTFLMISLGFSVCGFHVAFLGTHFPAYCVSWMNIHCQTFVA
jgi:hypothetical protein